MEAHLKILFARYHQQFGTGPGLGPSAGTCLLKVDGISPSFIKSLFRASAALYRTEPWRRLRPGHLLGVRVGKDTDWSPKKQLFPCVQFVGGDGGDLGLHLFKSEQDAHKATGARETKPVPNAEVLRVIFVKEALLLLSNRRMINSLSLEAAGDGLFPVIDVARWTPSGGVSFRDPTVEELRCVYASMKAVALVHPLFQSVDDGVPRRGRLANFEPFIETVDVQWPPDVAKGGDLVAITISYPSEQAYDKEEKKRISSPLKYLEPPKEELPRVEVMSSLTSLRQCAMCEKSVNGDESLCCGRCRTVVYCGAVCQKQHWKEKHKSVCELYKSMMEREEELALKIFIFPCFAENPCKWLELMGLHQKGMWRRICNCYSRCPFGLLPSKAGGTSDLWGGLSDREYPPDFSFPNYMNGTANPIFLSSWSEYYNLRSLPMSSPVAAILSHVLTVYHILTTLLISSKNLLIKGNDVIVHYLGPAVELDWNQAFSEIGYLLNGSGNVQITMIGPDVPSNLSGTVLGSNGRLKVNAVRGLYQEQASYLSSPHSVIALNCGLGNNGSWASALELIKLMNVPAFFTERSEILCTDAKQALRAAGLQVTHPVTPNPFRSPLREQSSSTNLPSFSNCFVFGINT